MGESYRVAVIGAGVAGLVTARELQREGHHVTVFEKDYKVGGIWLYNPLVETDPLGLDSNREIVHSSLYKSLRVNSPRHTMSFSDYPFVKKEGGDPRTFPGHEEVLRFLEDFARDFGLMELIRFGHEVIQVELSHEVTHQWIVESRARKTESTWEQKEVFEALVICNGNFTEPNIAQFPGRDTWPGLQMHSHNYRTPEQFKNKIVVLIGKGPSGIDILKEIAPLAKEVHQAVRTPGLQSLRLENYSNTWRHSMIECAHEDGRVIFQDGSTVDPDIIIHCTGFKYHCPFLKSNGIVTVDDNRVKPLYKHVFPPKLAPWLSFVGLTYRAVVFRVMELQAKWVAKVLSGTVELPPQEAMACSVEEFYSEMENTGWPKHHTHSLQNDEVEYVSWIAAQLDIKVPKTWKEITFQSMLKWVFYYGENYRDTWDVDKWIQEIDSSD
ncbi:Flavin-containing monooxygenase FMO GS-OX5 [Hibiscus syriacus]|uniref:Flavin-containing monooxygenase n=1 Tax=Hibiscus syriacus TaxID=106335 RepID=A0A6A3A115_HIBSY|nr:flavin-containing monooxygenase FMO GS-OX-like 3 [Hibiscus syriacus]KAE8697526.1 Flavin-containing monooxygenase FMO GS-OX5 [Hibiscus syriacus]